jgi:methionine sulfoxide reductase heme-binding subunit
VAFARLDPVQFHMLSSPGTIVSGGIAYGFIVAMALTSFDRSAAWIGPKAWRALHWVGGHYICISFVVTNGKRIGVSPFYAVPVLLMLGLLGLRVLAWRRARRNRSRVLSPLLDGFWSAGSP